MSKWRGSLVLGLGFFLIWVAAELSGIVQLSVIPNDNGWGRWVPVVISGVSGVALATWGNEIIRQQRKIARQQKKQRPSARQSAPFVVALDGPSGGPDGFEEGGQLMGSELWLFFVVSAFLVLWRLPDWLQRRNDLPLPPVDPAPDLRLPDPTPDIRDTIE